MLPKFEYQYYCSKLLSINDVISQMQGIQSELIDTDLDYLIPFNNTYYIITKNVYNKFNSGYFKSDQLMKEFDIVFARYYFDALHEYVTEGVTTPSWQMLFDNKNNTKLSALLKMALGVNSHVNNDLPFSLKEVAYPDNYNEEFRKINPVIYNSLDEVIDSLDEKNKIRRFILLHFKWLYFPLLKFIITLWRNNAWKNFIKLQSNQISPLDIQNHAFHFGKYIKKLNF